MAPPLGPSRFRWVPVNPGRSRCVPVSPRLSCSARASLGRVRICSSSFGPSRSLSALPGLVRLCSSSFGSVRLALGSARLALGSARSRRVSPCPGALPSRGDDATAPLDDVAPAPPAAAAMFRSLLVAAAQRPQGPAGTPRSAAAPGAAAEALEAQFSCPICLEVFHRAVGIAGCGHTFCGECLQPCLQVPSPLCPLCRVPFDPKKVEKASSVEKQLSSYKAPCRGCSKKVTLAKMRSHVSSCAKVQEQMANCPKFVPVVPTSQPIPSNIPNRSTFVCPYCGARNLDQQELVKHCMENHRNDPNKVVCPVCSAMPWGDPSYKSANFLQHLLHRHKFSYDTFVDYNIDEEAALQAALALSLSEN
ncbi:E3 ubiquitin-protein ligase RNF166 [Oenanthe melanoleuca]|uniref:E3 ubiquitin-protein ligase RNF166 n=1 Tax=Oenanthe melanoleuca TaxID=2939378 RepID=UPI0024C0F9E0|nr:E3 ubiquitin-protein ligase RNF166 [Oenanthe melanoleuca]